MPRKLQNDDIYEELDTEAQDKTMLQEHLDELKENCSKIKLYRKGSDRKMAFVTEYDPSQWDLNSVKEEFGGGVYMIWAYDENKKLKGKYPLNIDERIKGKIDRLPEMPKDGHAFNPMEFIQPMLANSREGTDKIMLIMQENSKQIASMMTGMMQVFGAMMVAQNSHKQEKPVAGNIDELIKLKMLFGDDNKTMNMFMKGLEFANNQKPEETPFWQDLIKGVLPAIPAMFAGGMIQPPGLPQPEKTPEEKMKIAMMLKLSEMGKRLDTACRTAENPETLVDYLIESAESINIIDKALEVLSDETWYDKLCELNPVAKNYKDYLYKCHALIIEEFADEETDPATSSEQPIPGGKT